MKLIKVQRVSHLGRGWICPALEKPAEMVVGKLCTSPPWQSQVWPLPAWMLSGANNAKHKGHLLYAKLCRPEMVLLDTRPSLQSNSDSLHCQ